MSLPRESVGFTNRKLIKNQLREVLSLVMELMQTDDYTEDQLEPLFQRAIMQCYKIENTRVIEFTSVEVSDTMKLVNDCKHVINKTGSERISQIQLDMVDLVRAIDFRKDSDDENKLRDNDWEHSTALENALFDSIVRVLYK
jgi:hypothetical protein